MSIQQKSDKIEKRLNAGNAIIREAIADFEQLAQEAGLPQADIDEIAAKGQSVKDALQDLCDTLRAKAPGAGVTPQSGGGPKS